MHVGLLTGTPSTEMPSNGVLLGEHDAAQFKAALGSGGNARQLDTTGAPGVWAAVWPTATLHGLSERMHAVDMLRLHRLTAVAPFDRTVDWRT